MRDRWYISVQVANVIKRLSSAAGANSGNSSRAAEMSIYAGEELKKKYSKFLIVLSFACGLWEFRQPSPFERFA